MIYIKYAASICFILAMASELIGFMWLHRLHVAACNPKLLKHQLLKQIFLRFTNCAKLNIRIANTPAFVTRYLSNYTYFGLHYTSFEKLGFTFAISGIIISTYGTFRYPDLFVKYALMAILVAIVYAFFCSLLDIKEKQQQIVILITDYLDNTLSHRLASRFGTSTQQNTSAPASANATVPAAANTPDSTPAGTSKSGTESPHTKEAAASTAQTSHPLVTHTAITDTDTSDEIIFSVINDFLV